MYSLTFWNAAGNSSVPSQGTLSPHFATTDTRLSPRSPALEVQPKISVELEESEWYPEMEVEPTAMTRKAIATAIHGSWPGNINFVSWMGTMGMSSQLSVVYILDRQYTLIVHVIIRLGQRCNHVAALLFTLSTNAILILVLIVYWLICLRHQYAHALESSPPPTQKISSDLLLYKRWRSGKPAMVQVQKLQNATE